jgi:hypothetical protein
MSLRTPTRDVEDGAVPVAPSPPVVTLSDIVEESPRWRGPDRQTVRQGVVAVLGVLGFAVLLGAATGLVLYWVLVRALAYLS